MEDKEHNHEEHKEEHKVHHSEEHNKGHHTHQHKEHVKKDTQHKAEIKEEVSKPNYWMYATVALVILLVASVATHGFRSLPFVGAAVAGVDIVEPDDVEVEGLQIIVLNDKRCDECDATQLIAQLKNLFQTAQIKEIDYGEDKTKELYKTLGLTALPAVLFTEEVTEEAGYAQVKNYLQKKEGYYFLNIGASFDPEAEICDNGIDDDGNGLVDCEDESCNNQWKCMPKTAKPKAELFIMTHCPYGTQAEKGFIPAMKELGAKVDAKVRFVHYFMHGEKEKQETYRQICIREEQPDKFIDYLECFLEGDGNADASGYVANGNDPEKCMLRAGIDADKLDACMSGKAEEYYAEDSELSQKYGVRGSPSLVVNGVMAQGGRDPSSMLKTVCVGYDDKPEACSSQLSTAQPAPGFGYDSSGDGTSANCGA